MASSGGEATGEKRSRFRDHWLLGRKIVELSDSWPPTYVEAEQEPVLARINSSITWHTWAHRQATRWYSGLTAAQVRPYDQPTTRDKVLARRVELIIGAEVGRWAGAVAPQAERGGDG